jgi:hypothetical protein
MIDSKFGETGADFSKRYQHWPKAWQERLSLGWQEAQFDKATRVSLARVIERSVAASDQSSDPPPAIASFKPLVAIKGQMPTQSPKMTAKRDSRCAVHEEGSAAFAEIGDSLFFFEQDGENGQVSVNGVTLETTREPRVKQLLPDALLQAQPVRR